MKDWYSGRVGRTLDDVKKLIDFAKVNHLQDDVVPFSRNLASAAIRLFEIADGLNINFDFEIKEALNFLEEDQHDRIR